MSNIQQNINQMISSAAIATNLAKSVEEQKKAADEAAKANAIKEGEMKAESDNLKAEIGKEQVEGVQSVYTKMDEDTKDERQIVEDILNNKLDPKDIGYSSAKDAVVGINSSIWNRVKSRVDEYKNSDYYKELESLKNSEGNISRWQLTQAKANKSIKENQEKMNKYDKLVKGMSSLNQFLGGKN